MSGKNQNIHSLKAIVLLGTLKRKNTFSHTETLSELLAEDLKKHNTETEIVRLVDYNIRAGIETRSNKKDDWPRILKKILSADIVILATPIWWGMQSSLIQRIIERMDALNDKLLETGESELANKVGGIVITGDEDGAQHIVGNLCNFMVWNGFTMPPACSLSWLGRASKETKKSLAQKFRKLKSTVNMSKTMARNLTFFARLLKAHPVPQDKGAISQSFT